MTTRRQVVLLFLGGFCVLACGLVGNGLYYSVSEFRTGTAGTITGIRFGFLCLLVVLGCIFYRLYWRQFGAHPTLWFGAFLAAITAGAGADSWQTWLESFAGRQPVRFPWGPTLYTLFFLAALVWAGRILRRIPSLVSVRNAPPERRSHLVLFLSEIDLNTYATGVPDWLTGSERNLCDDLVKLAEEKRNAKRARKWPRLWPWEQPLRAIHHHLQCKTLKSITVIASNESILQAPRFAALLRAYPALMEVDCKIFLKKAKQQFQFAELRNAAPASEGCCFEDFTELSQALHSLLLLLSRQNLDESNIMIDFTGGKKVTSVVAAAMTFNRSVKAQYVQTEDPWEVLSYSVTTPQRPI